MHGTATTEVDGTFVLEATELVDVPGCWGTLVDYWVTAELDVQFGEVQANHKLYNALNDGSFDADFSTFPVEMSAL